MKLLIMICSQKKIKRVFFLFFLMVTTFLGYLCISRYTITANMIEADHQLLIHFEPGKSPEGSLEELYRDVFMSFVTPYIKEAVCDYYKQPFNVDLWSSKILSIERPNGYRTFFFILKIEVQPYYGPHNSVGVDQITLTIGSSGKVTIKKFEHIKTYELPIKQGNDLE